MKKIFCMMIFVALCFSVAAIADDESTQDVNDSRGKMKPWDKGAWEAGKCRNVFLEAGYKQEDIDTKLARAYYDLFEGPNRVYFEVGDDMAYVSDLKNHDARTEGLSYGMMVAVQLNKKDVFDRLWRWTVKYMQHQEGSRQAYFAWSVNPQTGKQNSPGSASDGEFYFVTDLLFASNRWGNDTGIDYYGQARRILDAMWSKDGTGGIRNVINTEHKMITFVPEGGGYNWTDPSYHVPAFFEIWAEYAKDGHEDFYRECADVSRQFLHKACHPVTGLTPDYAEFSGDPLGGRMSAFGFDSWRVPMNIAMDYSWYAKDKEWQQGYCRRLQDFLFSRGIDTFEDQFNVDGTARERIMGAGGYRKLRHSLGWVSTTAAASIMGTQAKSWKFVDAVWNAKLEPYEDGYFDPYYDGFLYLFSLMHLSGNYRIIKPVATENPLEPIKLLRPAAQEDYSYCVLESGVQLRIGDTVKNILFYGPATVRVNENLGCSYWEHPSIVVVGKPAAVPFKVLETPDTITIVSDKLQIKADKKTGALTFMDGTGKVLTQERAQNHAEIKKVEISGAPTYEVSNTFTLKPDEGWYGFGYVDAAPTKINRRGQQLLLIQTNMGIVIPMIISSERYGIMWDTYSIMRFKDDATGATLWAESAPGGVDYYVFAGDTMDDVIAGYRDLTGNAPMYPKQALGLFMSKERYQTQERIIEVARTFRKEQFPLDYIVQDWQYWGSDKDGTWSGMIWNPQRYPDPEGMTKVIHDLHMKLMISIWPSVGNDTPLAHELDQYGLRFEPLHWISRKARIYDAFSKKGREIYFKHIKEGLLDKGVDALWMDGTEVEVGTACWNPNEVARDIKKLGINAMGDFSRYLNPYTLMTTKGTYEGQRAVNNQRVFTLTRSAWCGAQRYAAASWSGDSSASWDTFKAQMAGGLDVTMSGNAWWTQDIGGFFVNNFPGGEQNEAYRELFTRWYQFGAFNPIFRIHGTNIEREPYIFKEIDPEMYQALLDITHLRYRLMPYLYSQSWKVTSEGYTLMRGLPLDFPDDVKARNISDAFMFGPAFLVHPVTHAMYRMGTPPAPTLPAAFLQTPDGKPGLAVQYFAGVNFDTPKGRGIDKVVDHDWPGPPLADPPGGLDVLNNFSARWEGFLVAPEDGEYEIGVEGDDGFRLYLDGKKVVEDWSQAAARYRSTKVTLRKGQKVLLKMEFYQGGGERVMRLGWRTPSDIRDLQNGKKSMNNVMETYLPAGADWYDFWTNEKYEGGRTAEKECPLNILPLYVRAGSIVPMGPVLQYATEKPDAPYEIRIYPGADATFTLYEDDNETYNYEKGEYATYDLVWNDSARTLTVGPRKGAFPEMVTERTLNIVLTVPGKNAGIETGVADAKTVNYIGEPIVVKF